MILIELEHAGKVFPGTREEIHQYLEQQGYQYVGSLGGWRYQQDLCNKRPYFPRNWPLFQCLMMCLCAEICLVKNTKSTWSRRRSSVSFTLTTASCLDRRSSEHEQSTFCSNIFTSSLVWCWRSEYKTMSTWLNSQNTRIQPSRHCFTIRAVYPADFILERIC